MAVRVEIEKLNNIGVDERSYPDAEDFGIQGEDLYLYDSQGAVLAIFAARRWLRVERDAATA